MEVAVDPSGEFLATLLTGLSQTELISFLKSISSGLGSSKVALSGVFSKEKLQEELVKYAGKVVGFSLKTP